jgi:hypothetical protein
MRTQRAAHAGDGRMRCHAPAQAAAVLFPVARFGRVVSSDCASERWASARWKYAGLIVCNMTGWGREGPDKDKPVYDIAGKALSRRPSLRSTRGLAHSVGCGSAPAARPSPVIRCTRWRRRHIRDAGHNGCAAVVPAVGGGDATRRGVHVLLPRRQAQPWCNMLQHVVWSSCHRPPRLQCMPTRLLRQASGRGAARRTTTPRRAGMRRRSCQASAT